MNEETPRPYITVVTGLPRSGTSMMMQVLRAGGMEVATDSLRAADESNPRGYFELEAVKRLRSPDSRRWLGELRGKAVKVIFMLLYYLPDCFDYRVILMRRDLGEVLMSQRAMLARAGRAPAEESDARLSAAYRRELERVEAWMESRRGVQWLAVDYGEFMKDARAQVRRVDEFLGGGLDAPRMAAAVDGRLYRCRRA
jgi:hypothetical protein